MNSRIVVLVDASMTLLNGVGELLRQHGLEVVGFQSFESARAYLQRSRPGALVTDVRLGAFNGLHLVIVAKQQSPDLTAFVYSSSSDPFLQQEAARCGATYATRDDLATVMVPALQQRLGQVH